MAMQIHHRQHTVRTCPKVCMCEGKGGVSICVREEGSVSICVREEGSVNEYMYIGRMTCEVGAECVRKEGV